MTTQTNGGYAKLHMEPKTVKDIWNDNARQRLIREGSGSFLLSWPYSDSLPECPDKPIVDLTTHHGV